MEAEPRVLELRGAAIQKVNHAYGTNGVITEVDDAAGAGLALGRPDRRLRGSGDRGPLRRCLARQDGLVKKLISVVAAPIGELYFRRCRAGSPRAQHLVLLMLSELSLDAFRDFPDLARPDAAQRAAADPSAGAAGLRIIVESHDLARAQDRPDGHLPAGSLPAPVHVERALEMHRQFRRRGHAPPRIRPFQRRNRLFRPADRALHDRIPPRRDHPPPRGQAARSSIRTPSRSRKAA